MDRLKDRVVVITGAGRGIGASCAKSMAAEGAAVVLAICYLCLSGRYTYSCARNRPAAIASLL